MLAVILLVVLAGGVGALAVWMVDPSGVRRLAGRLGAISLRGTRGRATAPTELPGGSEPAPSDHGVEAPVGVPAEVPADVEVVATLATGPAPVPSAVPVPALAGPVRRRRRGAVPAAFTAVEGTYREVAVMPLWRKALSLVLLLAVLLAAGVGLAAVAAAVLGAAAELVDGAVG